MKLLLKAMLRVIKNALFLEASKKVAEELNRAERRIDEKLGSDHETTQSSRDDSR